MFFYITNVIEVQARVEKKRTLVDILEISTLLRVSYTLKFVESKKTIVKISLNYRRLNYQSSTYKNIINRVESVAKQWWIFWKILPSLWLFEICRI